MGTYSNVANDWSTHTHTDTNEFVQAGRSYIAGKSKIPRRPYNAPIKTDTCTSNRYIKRSTNAMQYDPPSSGGAVMMCADRHVSDLHRPAVEATGTSR